MSIHCYWCSTDIDKFIKDRYEKQDACAVSNWYYNNNLYAVDDTVEVECPRCLKKFSVSCYPSISYETEIEENWDRKEEDEKDR